MVNILRMNNMNKIVMGTMLMCIIFMSSVNTLMGQETKNVTIDNKTISNEITDVVKKEIERDINLINGTQKEKNNLLQKINFSQINNEGPYYSPFTADEIQECLKKINFAEQSSCLDLKLTVKNNTVLNSCKNNGGSDAECNFQQKTITNTEKENTSGKTDSELPTIAPCDTGFWLGLLIKVPCLIVWAIGNVILTALQYIAQIAVWLFGVAINNFILSISSFFNPGEKIYSLWSGFRDVTNILVFFSAIFVGLRRILGDNSEDTAFIKNILKVFLFALLVNFSYTISRYLIDISNIISLFIYSILKENIGGNINVILSNLAGFAELASNIASGTSTINSWGTLLLTYLFMIAIFISFLTMAVMIIVRMITLILCVIFSPLMFAAGFLGVLDEWHKKWRENYIGMLIYSPILMIGLLITFSIISSTHDGVVTTTDSAFIVDGNTFKILFSLIMLFVTVKLSNSLSGSVGKYVSGVVGGAVKTMSLAAGGLGAGLALRSGLGATAGKIRNSKWVQNQKANGTVFGRNLAGLIDSGAKGVQNTRFKIGKYGVSDTYSDKVNDKKAELNNQLAHLDRTNPGQALKAREALRKQGNTIGDVKNIGKIINEDKEYLNKVNSEKVDIGVEARKVSEDAKKELGTKKTGTTENTNARNKVAQEIRKLRQDRRNIGYGLDTKYNPQTEKAKKEKENEENNNKAENNTTTKKEEIPEILTPTSQSVIDTTTQNTGKSGFLQTTEERLQAKAQLERERASKNPADDNPNIIRGEN